MNYRTVTLSLFLPNVDNNVEVNAITLEQYRRGKIAKHTHKVKFSPDTTYKVEIGAISPDNLSVAIAE